MWQRISGFLVVFLLMFPGKVFAQENLSGKGPLFLPQLSSYQLSPKPFVPKFSHQKSTRSEVRTMISSQTLLNLPQASYYIAHLGFFCKKEIQIEKVLAVPLRFRLGSLDYVNWMERKPNAIQQR